ncbi:MAG: phosphate ABC transporter substrate-binding protein PstS [Candidatus Sulfotelmatobacter sp.]
MQSQQPGFSKTEATVCRLLLRSIVLPSIFGLLLSGGFAEGQTATVLVGSGSTVPAPLYARWSQEYGKRNSGIQTRYLSVSTNEGIKQISHGAGDFAAGEAQLTEKERKEDGFVEMPVVLISIVPIYNLPGVDQELRLSAEVLAGIFLGEIKMWNAPQIARLNPNIALPNLAIRVIIRPAGKGSNFVFTDFLSKANSRFRAQVGVTASPKWPVGTPTERSSDMADNVRNTPGSIGYVEYQYAVKKNIPDAAVLNSAGNFVKASPESLAAACQAVEAPRWNNFSASLTYAGGANSFPSFTWIYLQTSSRFSARRFALHDLLSWIYSDGQRYATQEGYSELPAPLLAALRKKVDELE